MTQSQPGQMLRKMNRAQRRQLARQQRKTGSKPPKMLAVARPDSSVRDEAIARLRAAKETNDRAALEAVITALPHKLVGYYPGDGKENIVDENGKVIGLLQPGDSLVKIAG